MITWSNDARLTPRDSACFSTASIVALKGSPVPQLSIPRAHGPYTTADTETRPRELASIRLLMDPVGPVSAGMSPAAEPGAWGRSVYVPTTTAILRTAGPAQGVPARTCVPSGTSVPSPERASGAASGHDGVHPHAAVGQASAGHRRTTRGHLGDTAGRHLERHAARLGLQEPGRLRAVAREVVGDDLPHGPAERDLLAAVRNDRRRGRDTCEGDDRHQGAEPPAQGAGGVDGHGLPRLHAVRCWRDRSRTMARSTHRGTHRHASPSAEGTCGGRPSRCGRRLGRGWLGGGLGRRRWAGIGRRRRRGRVGRALGRPGAWAWASAWASGAGWRPAAGP